MTLPVRVVKFRHRDLGGDPGYGIRAWFAESRTSTKPLVRTFKGAIGNQDAFYCTR